MTEAQAELARHTDERIVAHLASGGDFAARRLEDGLVALDLNTGTCFTRYHLTPERAKRLTEEAVQRAIDKLTEIVNSDPA